VFTLEDSKDPRGIKEGGLIQPGATGHGGCFRARIEVTRIIHGEGNHHLDAGIGQTKDLQPGIPGIKVGTTKKMGTGSIQGFSFTLSIGNLKDLTLLKDSSFQRIAHQAKTGFTDEALRQVVCGQQPAMEKPLIRDVIEGLLDEKGKISILMLKDEMGHRRSSPGMEWPCSPTTSDPYRSENLSLGEAGPVVMAMIQISTKETAGSAAQAPKLASGGTEPLACGLDSDEFQADFNDSHRSAPWPPLS
jgi:hypothetical protein